jgi:hypothetical protein
MILLFYLLGVFVGYGLTYGALQSMIPEVADATRKSDRRWSIVVSILSWSTVITVIIYAIIEQERLHFKIK